MVVLLLLLRNFLIDIGVYKLLLVLLLDPHNLLGCWSLELCIVRWTSDYLHSSKLLVGVLNASICKLHIQLWEKVICLLWHSKHIRLLKYCSLCLSLSCCLLILEVIKSWCHVTTHKVNIVVRWWIKWWHFHLQYNIIILHLTLVCWSNQVYIVNKLSELISICFIITVTINVIVILFKDKSIFLFVFFLLHEVKHCKKCLNCYHAIWTSLMLCTFSLNSKVIGKFTKTTILTCLMSLEFLNI